MRSATVDHRRLVQDAAAAEPFLVAEQEVLVDRRVRDQRLLLKHPRDAVPVRLGEVARGEGPAMEADLACIRPHHPAQDVEQGRLAGPVLADDPDDAVGRQLDRDVVEDEVGAEALAEPARFEQAPRRHAGSATLRSIAAQAFFMGEGPKKSIL